MSKKTMSIRTGVGPDPNRVINIYEKERWGQSSKVEKWGVNKRKRTESRDLMILGSGRSGTKFMARLFQSIGYDVGHEYVGKHGTSTHFFHTDHHWYPMMPWVPHGAHVGERLSDYDFAHVVHVVRDPLSCIPSIMSVFPTMDWEFAEDTGLIPVEKMSKLRRVMTYWFAVNERIEKNFYLTRRIKLEEVERQFPHLLRALQMPKFDWPDLAPTNKGTGYRASEPTTYDVLFEEDSETASKIKNKAIRYGYKT